MDDSGNSIYQKKKKAQIILTIQTQADNEIRILKNNKCSFVINSWQGKFP